MVGRPTRVAREMAEFIVGGIQEIPEDVRGVVINQLEMALVDAMVLGRRIALRPQSIDSHNGRMRSGKNRIEAKELVEEFMDVRAKG